MLKNQSILDLIRQRTSCRTYDPTPIAAETVQELDGFLASLQAGPFGAPVRFRLIAAGEGDSQALRGLGTYGFIRNPTAFLLAALGPGRQNLEDLGYLVEEAVLFCTALGLGTCWLGGTFRRSRFSARLDLRRGEQMPVVISAGYPAGWRALLDQASRQVAASHTRLPWDQIFFDGAFDRPLSPEAAGSLAEPLEMVRLAPSASNKQPWRVVQQGKACHFFLQRSPGYRERNSLGRVADLQRVDLGIALCHFELAAQDLGLAGRWVTADPADRPPALNRFSQYITTWSAA